MFCRDPFITYLKSFGYNVIRLPKVDIKPLQLCIRDGKQLERLGDMASLLESGGNVPLPPIVPDQRAGNISGQRTNNMSIGLGLSILGSIIGAMGGSKLGLDVTYKTAKSASFEFQDVYEDSIEVLSLDKYLTDADISPFATHAARLLEADDLFVITSTIKSSKFTVEAQKSDGAALEVEVPEIQKIVGGTVKVSGDAKVTTKITYEYSVPLVFGFKVVQLVYDDSNYMRFEMQSPGDVALRELGQTTEAEEKHWVSESAFVRLSDI